jgi:hypothetical protein
MGANLHGPRYTWVLASVAGIGAILLAGLLFREPAPARPGRIPAPVRPSVGLAPADSVLTEEADLFDRTPLFLPTKWNSAEKELPSRDPSGGFTGYPDKMFFTRDELDLGLPPPIAVPPRLADALGENPPGDPYLGIGRTGYSPVRLSTRSAYVEVAAAGTGQRVFARALDGAQPPGDGGWQPLEFLVAVDASGLVGPPVLTAPSGQENVDAYFRRYLSDVLRVGDRLTPGFYRIAVGP